MNSTSEAELLAGCRLGQPEAWDELFDRHYDPAARFIFQLAPEFTREDIEEICQETFLTVIRNIHSFKQTSQFQTWLFRIAANKAHDYRIRKNALKRGGGGQPLSLQAQDPETGLALDPPTPLPGPDELAINAEQTALLRQALDELGDPCREIIELRYYADLPYDQIAQTLKLNPKTVSSRLSKCLDRLEVIARKHLEKPEPFSV